MSCWWYGVMLVVWCHADGLHGSNRLDHEGQTSYLPTRPAQLGLCCHSRLPGDADIVMLAAVGTADGASPKPSCPWNCSRFSSDFGLALNIR